METDQIACKTENICYPVLYRRRLLSPTVQENRVLLSKLGSWEKQSPSRETKSPEHKITAQGTKPMRTGLQGVRGSIAECSRNLDFGIILCVFIMLALFFAVYKISRASQVALVKKNLPAMQETWV